MRTALACLLALAWTVAPALAQSRPANQLTIYVVDVEGGNATLFVTPSGESVLIDTGNGGAQAARDADRIMAAAKDAGVTQIDHLITTHWHGDHFGGMAELATRIPITPFHRPRRRTCSRTPAADEFLQNGLSELLTARPCTRSPSRATRSRSTALDWRIVAVGGATS